VKNVQLQANMFRKLGHTSFLPSEEGSVGGVVVASEGSNSRTARVEGFDGGAVLRGAMPPVIFLAVTFVRGMV
jgi:hypothetical protein